MHVIPYVTTRVATDAGGRVTTAGVIDTTPLPPSTMIWAAPDRRPGWRL